MTRTQKQRDLARFERDLAAGRVSINAHGNVLVRIAELRRELDEGDQDA